MSKLIPNRGRVGRPHIMCDRTSYRIIATGETITKNQWGNPLDGDALAQALRFHGFPGVIVEVRGNQHRGMELNGNNPNLSNAVIWEQGDVGNITIIGGEPRRNARIGNVSVHNNTGDLRIQNVTLMNTGSSFCPFLVRVNAIAGHMKLYDINFLPMDPTAWNGKGMKWNIRSNGVARWDCRNLNFHKAVEHGAYVDNHQGDSIFLRCRGAEMGRTLLQLPNRATSGPPAFGDLVVKGCSAINNKGDGGSDFTIVGNGEGTVWFLNNTSVGAGTGSQGAFTHWTDFGHGAYLTPSGYSTDRLVMINFKVDHPNADRHHVSVTGCKEAILANWDIKGNKVALRLNNQYGETPIDNGKFGLYTWGQTSPSQWPGWKADKKVLNDATGHILSDQEIDDLEYVRGRR